MKDDALDFVQILTAGVVVVVALWACVSCFAAAFDPSPSLGDEVTTTPEYTELFNDSFSGHVVSIDDMYIIRDRNGTERAFNPTWLTIIDKGE